MAYVIGSQKGKDIAKGLKTNETYEASDGSVWTKKADGSVSVKTSSGETFDNAYKPTPSGNSQYTGSSNAVNVNTIEQQNIKDQMNANSIAWWNADEAGKKQLEQANRNLAAQLGGSVAYDPATGTWGGSANNVTTQDDIRNWLNQYEQNNQRPTAPQRDPRIDQMLNEILNRDKFSYDVENDPLYQQYAQMYRREGDRAMQDTLAEVATGAGGMNTYAITAAQQANNYYNSQLNDKIPELVQLAYNMYLQDIDNQVRDLGLLQAMDDTQYSRYRDTMGDWQNDKSFAYGVYQDAVQQGNWNTQFANNNYWANKEFENNNYWKNKDFGQTELENSRTDRAEAQETIAWLIENGVSFENIDQAIIAKSGLSENAIRQMITNSQLKQTAKSTTRREGNDDDKPVIYTGENGGTNPIGLGIGPISDETLLKLVEGGAVILNADGTMQWANGYSPSNYQSVLEEDKPWSKLPGLTF